jgi:hypothetical protein
MTTPKKKRPRDISQLAASIVADATAEPTPQDYPPQKNPAAVALGRLGGLKGGKARPPSSPRRSGKIARKAPGAMETPVAIHTCVFDTRLLRNN